MITPAQPPPVIPVSTIASPKTGLAHLAPELGVHLQEAGVECLDLLTLLACLVATHHTSQEPNPLADDERAHQVLVIHLQPRELDGEILAEDLVRLGQLCFYYYYCLFIFCHTSTSKRQVGHGWRYEGEKSG